MVNRVVITTKFFQRKSWAIIVQVILATLLAACSFASPSPQPTATLLPPRETPSPTPIQPTATRSATSTPTKTASPPTPTDTPVPQNIRFAVIGDYGSENQAEAEVAALIKSWDPDLIITTGDNNYPDGTAGTIDENIGQYFHEFIAPYEGSYGEGAQENRFFPSLGNHDWHSPDAQPYLDYFTLPGNERYYDFTWGPVHFFAIDSDSDEPDGAHSNSVQANWLQSQLSNSDGVWKIVYMHHTPYSSAKHGSNDRVQWPFAEWGADVVLSGHDHTYERISMDGILYFVNGLGGAGSYQFRDIIEGSQMRYNEDHGAMLIDADEHAIRFQFINRQGTVIDEIELTKPDN